MIYFVQESGLGAIKIGYAKDYGSCMNRFYALQIGNPHKLSMLGVISGKAKDETKLQTQFAEDHIRGEWFKPSSNLLKFIKDRAAMDINTPLMDKFMIKSEWVSKNKQYSKEKLVIYTDTRQYSSKDILNILPFDEADNVAISMH